MLPASHAFPALPSARAAPTASFYPLTIPATPALRVVSFAAMANNARARTPITNLLNLACYAQTRCQAATPAISKTSAKSATFLSIGS